MFLPAKAAAERALARDESLAEGHTVLAEIQKLYRVELGRRGAMTGAPSSSIRVTRSRTINTRSCCRLWRGTMRRGRRRNPSGRFPAMGGALGYKYARGGTRTIVLSRSAASSQPLASWHAARESL